jgi:dephospho-CoA kinase
MLLKVGLTGGIASGKSLVAAIFRRLGAYIVDTDAISREIVNPGEEGWNRIVEYFGSSIIKSDGTIDRRMLGEIIFSDSEKRKALNRLLHPLIIEKTNREIEEIDVKQSSRIVVVEIPLLIECGLQHDFDIVVVIVADRMIQKNRLMKRNKLNGSDAEARINSQSSFNENKQYAFYIIENSGTKKELENKVTKVYNCLKNDLAAKDIQS